MDANQEYYLSLPRKRMGAGLILLNEANELLLVKPSYKDHWSIVGGVVDANESPRAACLREAAEEIGIEIPDAQFLGLDYVSNLSGRGDSLQFIFFGGWLAAAEIAGIKVDGQEIAEWRFADVGTALGLVSSRLRARLEKCLVALEKKTVVYLEDGN